MPEGVEHSDRFAFSLDLRNVPLAVMPEGVEHDRGQDPLLAALVPLAVMPEGVEHKRLLERIMTVNVPVPLAVMPEGVEHERCRPWCARCERSRSP